MGLTNLFGQTNHEKEFVGYILGEAESIHEEDVVKKDNELKRVRGTVSRNLWSV